MATPLQNIIDLQHVLDRLTRAEALLDGIPDWMRELDAEYQERRTEMDRLEAELEQAASERRAADAGISDAQEKLKRYQKQINDVTNQREYGALLQEIDTVKTEISELETQGLDAMERREEADKALAEQKESFAELEQRYQVELEKWEAEKPGIVKEAAELRAELERVKGELPRPYLANFERIYDKMNGTALAPIRETSRPKGPIMWHCGACNFNVRPNVVVEIRNRGGVVQCDSCKRILYVEAANGNGDGSEAEAEA